MRKNNKVLFLARDTFFVSGCALRNSRHQIIFPHQNTSFTLDEVGAGIATKIAEGVVKREDLFVTSKLWNVFHNPNDVQRAFKMSLDNFGLDYIDLYLMHFPMGFKVSSEYTHRQYDTGYISDIH